MVAKRKKRLSYSQRLKDHEKEDQLSYLRKVHKEMISIVYDEKVRRLYVVRQGFARGSETFPLQSRE